MAAGKQIRACYSVPQRGRCSASYRGCAALVQRAALVKCSCTCTLVPRSIVRAFLIEEQKVVKKVCEGLGWGRLQRMWW